MQVLGINLQFTPSFRGRYKNNQDDYSRSKLFTPPADTFTRTATAALPELRYITTKTEFRDLAAKRVIHCPYCGQPMLGIRTFYELQDNGVFSGPISEFVKQVKPYEKCLKPGNREVFKSIEQHAKKTPNAHLSRVITLMYNDSLKKLRNAQKPIFMEFEKAMVDLPDSYKPKLAKFMDKQTYKLLEIPYIDEFNSDDFQYKLKRLAQTLNNTSDKSYITQLADTINHPAFRDESIEIPDSLINKVYPIKANNTRIRQLTINTASRKNMSQLKNDNNLVLNILCSTNTNGNTGLKKIFIKNLSDALQDETFDSKEIGLPENTAKKLIDIDTKDHLAIQNLFKKEIQLHIINKIKKTGEKQNRRDIVNLCNTYEDMLLGKPVVIAFSNKAFLIELVQQLHGLEKTEIHSRLLNIAKKLPNSESNKNSFVAHHKLSNSNTIGYYLLRPSVATIEHIKPTHDKGKNDMSNWALACEADNNKRMHTRQEEFLTKFDPKNPQKYFDDIIKAANEGLIDPKDVIDEAKAFKIEGNVIINTKRLKGAAYKIINNCKTFVK